MNSTSSQDFQDWQKCRHRDVQREVAPGRGPRQIVEFDLCMLNFEQHPRKPIEVGDNCKKEQCPHTDRSDVP